MSMTSCISSYNYGSDYQARNLHKFSKNKHYRTSIGGPRYVPARKRGDINHPAVTVQTQKRLKRYIKRQRYTSSS